MGLLEELGIRPFINAAGTYSRLGSPRIVPEALAAMAEVADVYLDLAEFQHAVNARIARRLGVDAALVTAGAAAGVYLATLACLTRGDEKLASAAIRGALDQLPRRDVVWFESQENTYHLWARVAGGRLVAVRPDETGDALRAVIGPQRAQDVAAVLFMAGEHAAAGAPPLRDVIELAHAAGVPVIVDAAAQLPPKENFSRIAESGADLVLFSGGKGIRAPGGTGLMVGRNDLVQAAAWQATPRNRLGRAMKVTKEDLAGFLAALERFLAHDETAERERCEAIVDGWQAGLTDLPWITVEREFPGEAGKPLPRLIVALEGTFSGKAQAIADCLGAGDPPVAVVVGSNDRLYLNPETVRDEEASIVLAAVQQTIREMPAT